MKRVLLIALSAVLILCSSFSYGDSVIRLLRETDEDGRITMQTWADEEGNAVAPESRGFASVHTEYGEGYLRTEYLDINGAPVCSNDGYAVRIVEFENDQAVSVTFLDESENWVLGPYGYASVKYVYSENNTVRLACYYGADGLPQPMQGSVCQTEKTYDSEGNTVRVRYFDRNGDLIICDSGYAEVRRVFDSDGHPIRQEYYNTDGTPAILAKGYHAVSQTYDANGNIAVLSYFGNDKQPVICTEGYATVVCEWTESGLLRRKTFLDADGRPSANAAGIFQQVYEYNEDGRVTSEKSLDADGKVIAGTQGYSEIQWEYNEQGDPVRKIFMLPEGAIWENVTIVP